MRPKPEHPVQEDFDFLILLNIIVFIIYIYMYSPNVSLVICELLNAMVVFLPVIVGLLFVLVFP